MQNNIEYNNPENLGSTKPFVSFETVWANLKPELDKEAERRKKKRRFILFWYFLFSVGLGLGSYILLVNHSSNTIIKNTGKQETRNELTKKSFHSVSDKNIMEHKDNKSERFTRNENNKEVSPNLKRDIQHLNHENITELTNFNKHKIKGKKNDETTALETNDNFQSISIISSPVASRNSNKKEINNKTKSVENEKYNHVLNSKAKSNNTELNTKTFSNSSESEIRIERTLTAKELSNNSSAKLINEGADKTDSINKTITTIITEKQDSVKQKTDTNHTIKKLAEKNKSLEKKSTTLQTIHYGLQFNIPFGGGVNNKDINTHHQPSTVLIPTFWVSKQFGKKHSLSLQLNPYGQFYLNNKAIVDSSQYNVTIYQGALINNGPKKIRYTEIISFNKAISIEATLLYNYQLNKNIKIGAAISNNWIQGALMQDNIIRNSNTITRDSLYGINNKNKKWRYLKPAFMLGKLEAIYQFNKLAVGISFSVPVSNIFTNKINYTTPINKNVFIKWIFK